MSRKSRSVSQSQSHDESMEVEASVASIDQSMIGDVDKIAFTRCLLLNRTTTEEEIMALYLQCFTDDPRAQHFTDVLQDVNESLQECKIKIASDKCEITNRTYYLVIPTYFKPSQVWSNLMFKENELNFIKTVIGEIIVSDIGLASAERVIRKHKFMSHNDAKKILEKLVEENYLIEPRHEKYGLSVLARLELEPYFHYSFREILKKCIFCKRIVFFGSFCENCKVSDQTSSCHFSCLTKYRESLKNKNVKCPSCNKEWSRNLIESVEQIMDYEDVEIEDDE